MSTTGMPTALIDVLSHLLDGTGSSESWVLNPNDRGLLNSLDSLSAEDASRMPDSGGSSIDAHADHLRYAFELLNAWSRGSDAFKSADYTTSWTRTTVSAAEWAERRAALRRKAYEWRTAIADRPIADTFGLTVIVAAIAHLACVPHRRNPPDRPLPPRPRGDRISSPARIE